MNDRQNSLVKQQNGGNLPSMAVGGMTPSRPNNTVDLATSRQAQEVQAALVIAKSCPRDIISVTELIKNACARPRLAEGALYTYLRGGTDISGPSIRLAEAIAQYYGNLEFGFRELDRGTGSDGVGYSDVQAYCWDMQSNCRRVVNFRIRHWRDRKGNKGYALTDERDIYELMANMAQRRVRACILAVIPGDIVDEAVETCEETMHSSADTSPENIKKMVKYFKDQFGVSKAQIEKRIQRKAESITAAQMCQLKKVSKSLTDGMSSPEDWFEKITESEKAPEKPLDPFAKTPTAPEQPTAPRTAQTEPTDEEPDDLLF